MLDSVQLHVRKLVQDLDNGIVIESEVMYGNSKLEYALSKDEYMASVSILSDYTYDYFTVEIESEDVLIIKTERYSDLDRLLAQLKEDIYSFSVLK